MNIYSLFFPQQEDDDIVDNNLNNDQYDKLVLEAENHSSVHRFNILKEIEDSTQMKNSKKIECSDINIVEKPEFEKDMHRLLSELENSQKNNNKFEKFLEEDEIPNKKELSEGNKNEKNNKKALVFDEEKEANLSDEETKRGNQKDFAVKDQGKEKKDCDDVTIDDAGGRTSLIFI